MRKLALLSLLLAFTAVFASCAKKADTTPQPNHFTATLTVINQTPSPVTLNVLYGKDTGTAQMQSSPLTSATFDVGTTSKTFTADSPDYIYFLFIPENSNLGIYTDTGGGNFKLYGYNYNLSMYQTTSSTLTLLIKPN